MPTKDAASETLSREQRMALIGLRRRLGSYRCGEMPWSEVPIKLRREAVRMIDGGVAATYVRGVCEIPSSQLARWVSSKPSPPRPAVKSRVSEEPAPALRVLRVVPDAESTTDDGAVALTVQMGPWQLSLRLAGPGGSSSCCP
jgi:hypothetical protein